MLIVLSGVALGFLYYKDMITLPNLPKPKLEVIGDVNDVQYITVPVGDTEFYDVAVDSSCTLEYTNEENLWKFDEVSVMRTSVPVKGYHYDANVFYKDGTTVYTKVNNYYIVVISSTKLLRGTIEAMVHNNSYKVDAILDENYQEHTKFEASSVFNFKILDNDIIVPKDYSKSIIPNADSVSYFTKDGYLAAYVVYQTYDSAIENIVSKLIAQNSKQINAYYNNDNIFVAECGNAYAGVRKINYNTQLLVFSKGNDSYDFLIATLFGLN